MNRIYAADTTKYINQQVKVSGWVNNIRSHGKIIFIDLRDKTGVLQTVAIPQNKEVYEKAQQIKPEWVVSITGRISERPQGMKNDKIPTGALEMTAEEIEILSTAETTPFPIETDGYDISEDKRLQYRFLDLRRTRLQRNLRVRSEIVQFMREFLHKQEFIEIETPLLTKSTPEGARDYIVPSRLQPGKFYALPQSPQQYKQLLMVAGVEKYFQVVKCLRDEDPRGDRQPEFTQLDIEMSFVGQEEILNLTENLYTEIVRKFFPEKKILKAPFPRITYKEAMEKYNSDKPDIRTEKDGNILAFCFITDFPMFEWHEKTKEWGAMHHPFTKPQTDDIIEIKKNPEKILAHQYDLVLNGFEIAGGSLRNSNLEMMAGIFEVLGYKPKETKEKFKNYFEAFKYGVPPHGGIASGIDRFFAIAFNEPNIREVMAFPKTGDGRDLMMDAPSKVSAEQLKETHIKIIK